MTGSLMLLLLHNYADIDECQTGRSNCSQTCFNTVGSFKCGCMAGYSLDLDNSTCTGECIPVSLFNLSIRHALASLCTVHVYIHMRNVASFLSIVSGVDINECERSEHNCSQLCDNVPGGFVCGCEAGYSLQEDVVTCTGMLSCQSLSLCVCVCELLTYYVKSARL